MVSPKSCSISRRTAPRPPGWREPDSSLSVTRAEVATSSRTSSGQRSPHDDSVPEFTIPTPIVPEFPSLLDETSSAVEVERR